MKKYFLIATIIALLVVAMALAQAGDNATNETPLAYAAPTPSGITVTREPERTYEPTEPAPARTASPYGTEPAG